METNYYVKKIPFVQPSLQFSTLYNGLGVYVLLCTGDAGGRLMACKLVQVVAA